VLLMKRKVSDGVESASTGKRKREREREGDEAKRDDRVDSGIVQYSRVQYGGVYIYRKVASLERKKESKEDSSCVGGCKEWWVPGGAMQRPSRIPWQEGNIIN